MRLGLGLSITGRRGAAAEAVATATATMAQIPTIDARRVYQRTTTTGGGQGKGQGTIPLTISSASAGTVYARCRAADGTTILQAPWQLSNITNGQTTMNVSGVDARLGWFYLDILTAAGWQNGTTLVGMGRIIGFGGQSLILRMFGRQDGETATYSSLGINVEQNCSVMAGYPGFTPFAPATQPWMLPGDGVDNVSINSVGIGRMLGLQVAMFGVNCAAFSYSAGGTYLNTFLTGQANWTAISGYISRIGGAFESIVWGQGHSDADSNVSEVGFMSGLDVLFAQLTAANSRSYSKYVWTLPNSSGPNWGSPKARAKIRAGAMAWCNANAATYVHMYDIPQVDNIHQSQAGAAIMAQHMHRATRPEVGLSSGIGPTPLSAVRSGTTITLTVSDVGQSNLILSGTPANRIFVFPKGRVNKHAGIADNRFPVSNVVVSNKTTLTLTLANDPGDGHELDVYLYWAHDGAGTPALDTIRDDRIDGDGITVGRILTANPVPISVAAPVFAGAVNAPPSGFVAKSSPVTATAVGATFAAGTSGFGNEMTGGRAGSVGNSGNAQYPMTIEARFTCPPISGIQVVVGFGGYIAITSAGRVQYSNLAGGALNQVTLTGATTLVAGRRYHVAAQVGPTGGMALYLTDITSAGSGVRDAHNPVAVKTPAYGHPYEIRTLGAGNFVMSGGAVDEIAIFASERYSGATYTAPTAPFTGAEANLVALYHLDETSGATTLVESVAA